MLNLACGNRIHKEWTNVEYSRSTRALKAKHPLLVRILYSIGLMSTDSFERYKKMDRNFIYANLKKGIPLKSQTFVVVYHSHFIEHLDRDQALSFLQECYRVLKWGGTIRIVTPDLERIVQDYLSALKDLENGKNSEEAYDWAMLHLFDQFVRKKPGGYMQAFLEKRHPLVGVTNPRDNNLKAKDHPPNSFRTKITNILKRLIFRKPGPRKTGELHRWLYDRYSLKRLLAQAGFKEVQVCDEHSSRIKDWSKFDLDVDPDGTIYKPGSLYMEAVKKL